MGLGRTGTGRGVRVTSAQADVRIPACCRGNSLHFPGPMHPVLGFVGPAEWAFCLLKGDLFLQI